MSLAWKINRLRVMGTAEIVWRAKNALVGKLDALGLAGQCKIPVDSDYALSGLPWLDKWPSDTESELVIQHADEILAGRWNIFTAKGLELGFPPNWNKDPKTGIQAPLIHAQKLNYRDARIVGDIKYLWEPNRHASVSLLAQAYCISKKSVYLSGLQDLIESWIEACPYYRGVNWTSSLELALRLINWSFAWHMIGGQDSPLFADEKGAQFKQKWMNSIYQHCYFIRRNLSLHSSANNHLFGELTGVFLATVTWPFNDDMRRWRDICLSELEEESQLQFWPDGVNKEQAVSYQHETMDMMVMSLLFARANNLEFSNEFSQTLKKACGFIAALIDTLGYVPMIGDSDDAIMINLAYSDCWCKYRGLLNVGAIEFANSSFSILGNKVDQKVLWLYGDESIDILYQLNKESCLNDALVLDFLEGGYSLIKKELGGKSVGLVFDHGPLGYLSIAAHGHADALAMLLSINGNAILVDAGTYSYHADGWRDYFKGTLAHNTIRINRLDQSVSAGKFLWTNKANAQRLSKVVTAQRCELTAEHDGYTRYTDNKIIHRRTIDVNEDSNLIVVTDELDGSGDCFVEQAWHFDSLVKIACNNDEMIISGDYGTISFQVDCAFENINLHRGSDSMLGWASKKYGDKFAIQSLICSGNVKLPIKFITTFNF